MHDSRRPLPTCGALSPAAAVFVALSTVVAVQPWVAAAAEPPAITFDGQVRFRYEYRDPLDYRIPGSNGRPAGQGLDDRGDVALLRSRFGVRAVLPSRVRLHLELQDSRTMGTESSTLANTENVDAHQAYAEIDSLGGAPASLQLGRFEMAYGDARLIGNGDWGPNGRSFDGARARWRPGAGRVDAFVTWLGEGRTSGADLLFAGVIAGLSRRRDGSDWNLDLDVSAFARDSGSTAASVPIGVLAHKSDQTLGSRLRLANDRLELRLEGVLQGGGRDGVDVSAWAYAARGDLMLMREPRLKLLVEYAHASGDEDPGDGEWNRFDPLYPTAHGLLGYSDLAAWSNIADLQGGLVFGPSRGWTFEASVHRLVLAESRDAWIADNGDVLRRDPTGAAGDDVGLELDLTARWAMRPGVTLQGGYSRFAAGDFVSNTGGGGDQDWAYAQALIAF